MTGGRGVKARYYLLHHLHHLCDISVTCVTCVTGVKARYYLRAYDQSLPALFAYSTTFTIDEPEAS